MDDLSYIPEGFEKANGPGSLTEETGAAWLAQNHREYQELRETQYERTPETK